MAYSPSSDRTGSEWPAVAVALGILVLLGAVLVTATIRWTAPDLRDLIGTLAPVLGVVTGAFVTYFFTRQANMAAMSAAQTATDAAAKESTSARADQQSQRQLATDQTQRAQALHNALTTVIGAMNPDDAKRMLEHPTVSAALNSQRIPR